VAELERDVVGEVRKHLNNTGCGNKNPLIAQTKSTSKACQIKKNRPPWMAVENLLAG
jgi:hypothetical protein